MALKPAASRDTTDLRKRVRPMQSGAARLWGGRVFVRSCHFRPTWPKAGGRWPMADGRCCRQR
eukprot:7347393-Prymnesium_polylepis.2